MRLPRALLALLVAALMPTMLSAGERQVVAAGFPATFLEPSAEAPLVLFIAGSGPTDRDGNSQLGVSASYLAKLAAQLGAADIASLRYDKRGVPGSMPVDDESKITFNTFADDAAAIFDWLRAETGGRPIFLLGHSEGGMVAIELARRRPQPTGLVLLATPGRPPAEVLREQLSALPEPEHDRALAMLAQIEAGQAVHDVPPSLFGLFRPSAQPFLRSFLTLRPAATLASLAVPALVIGGGNDLQVGRADFDALVSPTARTQSRWFTAMNHVLVDTTGDRPANLATYSDPGSALTEGLVETIVAFINASAAPDRSNP